MFGEYFRITGTSVVQIFLLGAIGYLLSKRKLLGQEGVNSLSRLVVDVTLPIMIFSQLTREFTFTSYGNWWVFPLLSIAITAAGFLVGACFLGFIKGPVQKRQFLSLIAFQNSGYLPLALIASLLPRREADSVFIYLFLFLVGFNLVIWSLGVHMLSSEHTKKFELGSLFSPPVVAALFSLLLVFFRVSRVIPNFIMQPLKITGDCTLPLAMLVVGGNLAQVKLKNIEFRAVLLVLLGKLIILPALGLWLVLKLQLPPLVGLLIVLELSVPSATNLSVIIAHYKKEDLLISQGVFFSHILSLITIPLFLSLYFALSVIQ